MMQITDYPPRDLSVIIPASNEEATIGDVLTEVEHLRPKEVIVVVNGSTDRTAKISADHQHRVVEFTERLGHDVGRTVGARLASGSALLFVDADIVIPWVDLEPFVQAIDAGFDVALNDIDSIVRKYPWDPVSVQKAWLNVCLNQPSLQTASLTAVPNALSRRVFDYISPDDLSVPPRAYTKLVSANVSIAKANIVDVVTRNKIHTWHGWVNGHNLMEDLIVGDHLEALDWLRLEQRAAPRRSVPEDDIIRADAGHDMSRIAPLPAPPARHGLMGIVQGFWRKMIGATDS